MGIRARGETERRVDVVERVQRGMFAWEGELIVNELRQQTNESRGEWHAGEGDRAEKKLIINIIYNTSKHDFGVRPGARFDKEG